MTAQATNSDYIFIDNLRVDCIVGIHPWEQVQPQPLLFTLKLYCDFSAIFASAELQDSIDYAAVSQLIESHCHAMPHRLIETLAHDIIGQLFDNFPLIQGLSLQLAKPHAVSASQQVGLHVSRWRNQ
jgi:dihydroneopterin aldolase